MHDRKVVLVQGDVVKIPAGTWHWPPCTQELGGVTTYPLRVILIACYKDVDDDLVYTVLMPDGRLREISANTKFWHLDVD